MYSIACAGSNVSFPSLLISALSLCLSLTLSKNVLKKNLIAQKVLLRLESSTILEKETQYQYEKYSVQNAELS